MLSPVPIHVSQSRALPRPLLAALGAAVGLGALVGLGWLGLQVPPAPFPPFPQRTMDLGALALPATLPPPVDRYFQAAVGERLPIIQSAVLSGRGQLRLGGLTLPARFRFIHDAGRGYRHYLECTWFGVPVLRAHETYLDGFARLELPFGVVDGEPKVDLAANLAHWGESVWLPAILATDPSLRWEMLEQARADLVVPAGEAEDRLTVTFDEDTGLVQRLDALRYRDAADESKTPWQIEPLGWQTFDGVRVPSPVAVTWLDQGQPWLVMTIDDAVYNADVSNYIRSSGP